MTNPILLDQELLIFLNNLGSSAYDGFWTLMSHKLVWMPLYLYLLYQLFNRFGPRKILWILVFIGIGIGLSDQMANLFKHGVARLRPCHDPLVMGHLRLIGHGGKYGFFSAHAANSFFVATFFTHLMGQKMPNIKYWLFPWAILVSYSRLYLGVHYPLDVLFGGAFGYLIARMVLAIYLQCMAQRKEKSGKR
jgi:undecaprenyl-diphosphatase